MQAGRLQLVWLAAQPPRHWLALACAPVEDLQTRWVVCTPWPHVTEHKVLPLTATQLYVGCVGVIVVGTNVAAQERTESTLSERQMFEHGTERPQHTCMRSVHCSTVHCSTVRSIHPYTHLRCAACCSLPCCVATRGDYVLLRYNTMQRVAHPQPRRATVSQHVAGLGEGLELGENEGG
jgi:hypothetical protein